MSYLVETEGQKLWKRHVDQLKEIKDLPIQQPHRSNEFVEPPNWNLTGISLDESESEGSHPIGLPLAQIS